MQKNTKDYFNDLLPLKESIMQSMGLQEVRSQKHSKKKSSFIYPPYLEFDKKFQLPTHFSRLAKKYGTPYFSLHGLLVAKDGRDKMLYYTVCVNVEISEIVYREIRLVRKKPRPLFLDAIIYDSFHILAES